MDYDGPNNDSVQAKPIMILSQRPPPSLSYMFTGLVKNSSNKETNSNSCLKAKYARI